MMKKLFTMLVAIFCFVQISTAQTISDPAQKMQDILTEAGVVLTADQVTEIKQLADGTIMTSHPAGGEKTNPAFNASTKTFKKEVRSSVLTADQIKTLDDYRRKR